MVMSTNKGGDQEKEKEEKKWKKLFHKSLGKQR